MGYYERCVLCNVGYGHGKGFDRLARHSCDHAVKFARLYFESGADIELLKNANGWTQPQAEHVLRRRRYYAGS